MPSEKAARVSQKRRVRNGPIRSFLRGRITQARKLISNKETEAAEGAVHEALVTLDKAVTKGVLHRNNASRRKSRLMKGLNSAKG